MTPTISRPWVEHCIFQRGDDTNTFIRDYLGGQDRRILLVAGAGFDPRSTIISSRIAATTNQVRGVFIREERPVTSPECMTKADANTSELKRLLPDSTVVPVSIFAVDGAVIGGRQAARVGDGLDLRELTDVIVDFSALSKGVSFPLTRLLLTKIEREFRHTNLHVMVIDEALTDGEIVDSSSDKVGPIHGFQGGLYPAQSGGAAILWLPQLTMGQRDALNRIYRYIAPHEVCPVLPFPSSNPRGSDGLAEHFLEEFQASWQVDPRDVVYASEGDPLDLYRAVVRLDAERRRVFDGMGGSLTVLSPIGSKVTSIGALMAAIDQDFPIVHVEALSYKVDFDAVAARRVGDGDIVHIWLHGEAYSGITP